MALQYFDLRESNLSDSIYTSTKLAVRNPLSDNLIILHLVPPFLPIPEAPA